MYKLDEPYSSGVFSRFAALHLEALVKAYKATPDKVLYTPYTEMISSLLDTGHFAAYTRTEEGRGLLEIQARRIAGEGLPVS